MNRLVRKHSAGLAQALTIRWSGLGGIGLAEPHSFRANAGQAGHQPPVGDQFPSTEGYTQRFLLPHRDSFN